MQAIIIGAGRGQRLMPTTADTPKCFAEVGGRRILDWTLAALRANGIHRVAFVGGYQIDKVRAAYPELTFRHNADWAGNKPYPLKGWIASELAKMPTYYIMELDKEMAQTVAPFSSFALLMFRSLEIMTPWLS